jgi:hypothetical protein
MRDDFLSLIVMSENEQSLAKPLSNSVNVVM